MRIVLIHPYITIRDLSVDLSEPLGLISLATYLESEFGQTIEVSILDLYENRADKPGRTAEGYYVLGNNDLSYLQEELARAKPDVVGITCNFTAYSEDTLEVASNVKSLLPDVPVVLGGAHATMAAHALLEEHRCIDFIVRGEGEITFHELLHELGEGRDFAAIKGLSYRSEDGEIVDNEDRELIPDIDVLPMPDRKFVNMDRYMNFPRLTTWYTRKRPIASLMTSRGCPYDCVFCSTKEMWRRHWRARSAENVIQEIEYLVSKYHVKEITIFDDQFFANRKRVEEICEYFIQRKGKLYFSYDAGVSPWLVDADLLKLMKKAGFYALRFPIETGNENTLKFIKKPVDLEKSLEIVKEANSLGFWTSANFILGFPYETREEMEQTVAYAYRSGLDFASFIAARPHKGAELYEIYEKEGLLDSGVVHTSVFDESDYDSLHLSAKEITDIINRASKGWYPNKIKFYLNPQNFYRYVLPKVKSFDDLMYGFKMFYQLMKIKIIPLIRRS